MRTNAQTVEMLCKDGLIESQLHVAKWWWARTGEGSVSDSEGLVNILRPQIKRVSGAM